MALSKMERALLVRARELLEIGGEAFLCYALERAYRDLVVNYYPQGLRESLMRAYRRLRIYIGRALGDHLFLEGWQRARSINHSREQCRRDRLAWIDWMLDQPEIE